MNKIEAVQIFLRVAELSSFSQAADSMGLPKATVSTAVQQLEALLGTRLLHRTTRRVQMTQDGQVFYERGRDLLSDFEELEGLFQASPAALRGRLRVDMPIAVARDLVIPRLPEFMGAHPGLQIELSSTDRRVDVVREGFDCVLRVGALGDSSLIARPLGQYRVISCASPAYLQRHGTPQHLADLAHHQLVDYAVTLGAHTGGFEYLDPQRPGETLSMPMNCAITVNNSESYTTACLAGLGIIQAPEVGMRRWIEHGALLQILPDLQPPPLPVSLIYANRRHLPRRVQVFMNWMSEIVQQRLTQPG